MSAAEKLPQLVPAHLTLIDALAKRAVADYLTEQAAPEQAIGAGRSNHAPLLPVDKAA